MEERQHDKVGKGFNVSKEQLAHDLAILKLSKMIDIDKLNEYQLYDQYTNFLNDFTAMIEDKTRYDSTFNA